MVGNIVKRTMAIETKNLLCGGCIACDEMASGNVLPEICMDISDLGIVLCNGIGYVPGGGKPLAEIACWECSRLLQLGLDAQDIFIGARKLVSDVALLTESGWSTVLVVRFLADGAMELCFSGDTLGFVIGKGTAKPLGEAQTIKGVVPVNQSDCDYSPHHFCNISLEPGEWFCAMTGSVWKNLPLSCIAQTCGEYAGIPKDAAATLIDIAQCYGSRSDMAVAVVEHPTVTNN